MSIQPVKRLSVLSLALAISSLLAACDEGTSSPAAGESAPAPTSAAVPAKTDPNAIDAAIPANAFKVKLEQQGPGVPSSDGRNVTYRIKVDNQGTAALYGVGKYPITLGVTIVGTSGSADKDGGVRDFVRSALPLIPVGTSAVVEAVVPHDPRIGDHKLRAALVQEGITWHEEPGATLEIDTAQ